MEEGERGHRTAPTDADNQRHFQNTLVICGYKHVLHMYILQAHNLCNVGKLLQARFIVKLQAFKGLRELDYCGSIKIQRRQHTEQP